MSETQARMRELIDALRSGEYKQGKVFLKTRPFNFSKTMYCPLGVACELYRKHYPDYCSWSRGVGNLEFVIWVNGRDLRQHIAVPIVVLDFFGIDVDIVREVMRMNDKLGCNFFQIADYIEFHMNSRGREV